MVRLVPFVVVAVLGNGCVAPRAAIAVGVGTMLVGGVAIAAAPTCSGDPGVCAVVDQTATPIVDGGYYIVGGLLVAVGAALTIIGISSLPDDHAESEHRVAAVPNDAPTPAVGVLLSKTSNRMALQASGLARAGQCSAAVITAKHVAALDPELFRQLVAVDESLQMCFTLVRDPSQPARM